MSRPTGSQILAIAGTLSSCLVMTGGALAPKMPTMGPLLISAAGAVMLVGNVVTMFWRDRL